MDKITKLWNEGDKRTRFFMLAVLAIVVVIVLTLIGGTPAEAQSNRNCGQRDYVVERLGTKYGESRQAIGLGTNNQVVEVFASLETGTWTITVTTPAGMTCLVASGMSFETLAEAAIVPGEDM